MSTRRRLCRSNRTTPCGGGFYPPARQRHRAVGRCRTGRVREIPWGESVAVVVGAACPPRAYNNNLLWLLLWLLLLLLLLLWL